MASKIAAHVANRGKSFVGSLRKKAEGLSIDFATFRNYPTAYDLPNSTSINPSLMAGCRVWGCNQAPRKKIDFRGGLF